MSTWTAPSTGTFHFAIGHQPHPFGACGDWCAGVGWKGWVAKDAAVDPDDDPNTDPARFGTGNGSPTAR